MDQSAADSTPTVPHGADARVTFNVTTAHLRGADKLEFWKHMARQAVAGCEVSAPSDVDFDITARGIIQDGLSLSNIECVAPFDIVRDPDRSVHGWDDSILLFFVKSGKMLVTQDDRHAVIGPGDGVTLVADRPSTVAIKGAHQTSAIRLPRALIERPSELAVAIARPLLSSTPGVGALLFNFADSLCGEAATMDTVLLGRLAQSFTNLLGANCYAMSNAPMKHPPALSKDATLRRIKAFIDLHLPDPKLTVGVVAEAFQVSTRYLGKLFEREETSPARYIWDQRLDRAAVALARLSSPVASVKSIAYTHGFNDLSHFSAAFRKRFHEAPTQYRQRAWRSQGFHTHEKA